MPGTSALVLAAHSITRVRWGRLVSQLTTIALAIGLVLAAVVAQRQARAEAQTMMYRAAVTELANTVRAMRTRAMTRRQPAQLYIDASRGELSLIVRTSKQDIYGRVERTIWLPEGLQITDAPPAIVVLPNGKLSQATVRFSAAGSGRLFRLMTERSGAVHIHEDPLS